VSNVCIAYVKASAPYSRRQAKTGVEVTVSGQAAFDVMSMYRFVKGSRLFMQGKREANDADGVHDTYAVDNARARGGEDLRAVHTSRTMHVDGSTEWERSGRTVRSGGVRTRSTRTVRKVTTVTRGEQSVTSESLLTYASEGAQRYPLQEERSGDKRSLKFRILDQKVQPESSLFICMKCLAAISGRARSTQTHVGSSMNWTMSSSRYPVAGVAFYTPPASPFSV